MQAKGLVSEYQPKFNSARAVYRERKKYVDEIDWNMLAVPPTGSHKVVLIPLPNGHELHCSSGLQISVSIQHLMLMGQRITTSFMLL